MGRVRLDVEEQCLRIDDRQYYYEKKSYYESEYDDELGDLRWFKEDKEHAVSADSSEEDDEPIPVEVAQELDPSGCEWRYALVQIKDPHKIRKLNRRFTKAQAKAKGEEEKERRGKEAAEQREYEKEGESTKGKQDKNGSMSRSKIVARKLGLSSDSVDDCKKFDWEVVTANGWRYLHKKGKEPGHGWYRDAELKCVKSSDKKEHLQEIVTNPVGRTKWGTKIYSNDAKHFFSVGVWKSKGYPGCTTIRLYVAGRPFMYTLDELNMRALRAEISRGMPT
jgi:hypothetical protein